MAKGKTKGELEAELRFQRRFNLYRATALVLNEFIRWGGICVVAYFLFLSIQSLSGQKTEAFVNFELLANFKVSDVLAWIFGVAGVGYGWRQKQLRRETTERLQGRITALEKAIDPKRSSSGLTPRGDTHPKDVQ